MTEDFPDEKSAGTEDERSSYETEETVKGRTFDEVFLQISRHIRNRWVEVDPSATNQETCREKSNKFANNMDSTEF